MRDFYETRHELKPYQVYRLYDGNLVRLDRGVPGDGTKWYVQSYYNNSWFYDDETIEPGDIVEGPLTDPVEG